LGSWVLDPAANKNAVLFPAPGAKPVNPEIKSAAITNSLAAPKHRPKHRIKGKLKNYFPKKPKFRECPHEKLFNAHSQGPLYGIRTRYKKTAETLRHIVSALSARLTGPAIGPFPRRS
jgi:hypothetical protein